MNVQFPYDVYALASGRTRDTVERFTHEWLRGFRPAADDYELPRYATDPIAVYDSAEELIDVLLERPAEPHGIYWENTGEGSVATAMLFFTTDGQIIVGLTVSGDQNTALQYLDRLAKTVDARLGYITGEEPPPDTAAEFADLARRARPALVDGAIQRC
jgi:hypothetical protein